MSFMTNKGVIMEEAEKQLSEYINNKLYNYAFLIKGQWGAGKSYFLKEFIKKKQKFKDFYKCFT